MGSSDRPTTAPPRKSRSRILTPIPVRAQKWLGFAMTLLTAAGGAAASTWVWLDGQASDQELHDAIRDHDQDTYRDPVTGELIHVHMGRFDHLNDLRAQLEDNAQADAKLDAQLRHLYRIHAGRLAAETERNPRRRADAARTARERFDSYVRAGRPYDEALGAALSPIRGLPR